MATWSKTVYVEVEADDEEEAERIVISQFAAFEGSSAFDYVDLAGPIEEVTEMPDSTEYVYVRFPGEAYDELIEISESTIDYGIYPRLKQAWGKGIVISKSLTEAEEPGA